MAGLDYMALVSYVVDLLKCDDRLSEESFSVPVHVTDETEPPTMDLCPAVQVQLVRVEHNPLVMVAGLAGAGPDDVTAYMDIRCIHFSAQSTADARRQGQRLLNAVVNVLRDDPTLGASCNQWAQVTGIDFATERTETCWFSGGVVKLVVRGLH